MPRPRMSALLDRPAGSTTSRKGCTQTRCSKLTLRAFRRFRRNLGENNHVVAAANQPIIDLRAIAYADRISPRDQAARGAEFLLLENNSVDTTRREYGNARDFHFPWFEKPLSNWGDDFLRSKFDELTPEQSLSNYAKVEIVSHNGAPCHRRWSRPRAGD